MRSGQGENEMVWRGRERWCGYGRDCVDGRDGVDMGGYDTYSILVMVPASPRVMASSRNSAAVDIF